MATLDAKGRSLGSYCQGNWCRWNAQTEKKESARFWPLKWKSEWQTLTLWLYSLIKAGLRNSIIIELGIGFNIAFSNSIGIGIEIGFAKKSRPVLLLLLVLQFTLNQYWYWYCYRKTHSLSIGIGIVIAKHLQQILSLLLELQINFSSIDVKIVSEITLFLDNTGHLQMQNDQIWYP